MDGKTKQKLTEITAEFYSKVANSFSDTRQNAWFGWEKVLKTIDLPKRYELLDVACGNLRFENFLEDQNCEPKHAICLDDCEQLLPPNYQFFVDYRKVDLLLSEFNFSVDLAVCFGFMHHIPSIEARREFLIKLMDSVKSGGYTAISFWQFMKDERIATKAKKTTEQAVSDYELDLECGDYLLGWKDENEVFRYCHNFEDSEVESIISALGKSCTLIDQFSEDGKSHNLNKYVILKRT